MSCSTTAILSEDTSWETKQNYTWDSGQAEVKTYTRTCDEGNKYR